MMQENTDNILTFNISAFTGQYENILNKYLSIISTIVNYAINLLKNNNKNDNSYSKKNMTILCSFSAINIAIYIVMCHPIVLFTCVNLFLYYFIFYKSKLN